MATQKDTRIKSATFLTSLLDFSDVGELSVFIDDEQLSLMEEHMEKKGYMEGRHMSAAFNMLRSNDLIWSFVVKHYLLGEEHFPFDLLYWNSDSTRMPRRMHSFYLRNMYQHNKLCKPDGIDLAGKPIDLRKIKTPAYFLSTHDDHIAPWKSTYAGTGLLSGPIRFVLGGSGHIAGVINPASSAKYGYWSNEALPEDPDEWFLAAERNEGSWWLDWLKWVTANAGAQVNARTPGDGKLAAIEDAPGSYVKVRGDH
jgi:polyhydroxyalkanoate synthase